MIKEGILPFITEVNYVDNTVSLTTSCPEESSLVESSFNQIISISADVKIKMRTVSDPPYDQYEHTGVRHYTALITTEEVKQAIEYLKTKYARP